MPEKYPSAVQSRSRPWQQANPSSHAPSQSSSTPLQTSAGGTHASRLQSGRQVRVPVEPQVVAWAYERPGGGRGFGYTGGHYHANWDEPNARRLVLNAIEWTAGAAQPD